MERVRRQVTAAGPVGRAFRAAAVGFAAAPFGGGCLHVHPAADGKPASIEWTAPQFGGAAAPPAADGGVKPAGAAVPAMELPSFAKLTGKGDSPKGAVTELALGWHNRITYLPDPSQNGAMGAGLVGQMFLFGPALQFAPANGKLTVEMFDDPPANRGGNRLGQRLGGWTFDKEHLRKLVTMDERFGKSYALFLPWPDYTGEITRVRLTARYDPEVGYPLFSAPATVTIDTAPATGTPSTDPLNPPLSTFGPPAGAFPTAGGVATVGYTVQPGGPGLGAAPIPVGGGSATQAGMPIPAGAVPITQGLPPGGLPPIAYTMPAAR